jgi:hypothetical protein
MRNDAYRILVGKPEGKRPLGRPRRRWEDNTGMNLMEVGWEFMGWMHLVPNRDQLWVVVNMVMNLRIT